MGLIWALMSVALVSAAQLTLRAAMTTLPSAEQPLLLLGHLLHFESGTLGSSWGCWVMSPRWLAGTSPSSACRWQKPMRCSALAIWWCGWPQFCCRAGMSLFRGEACWALS